MTSVCPQRVRFRNCLAIQSGTRSFSPGEQTFAKAVSHHPIPLTLADLPLLLLEEEPWEEKGAPRRARVSMAAAHSGRSTLASPGKKGPKKKPEALGWCPHRRARDAGGP
nr:uncharacterized protein LOC110568621 [Aotus nancymaae]